MRFPTWLSLLALAACSSPAPPPPVALKASSPAVCRVGPGGTRPVADRGIGGTGAPPVQVADRGGSAIEFADRGGSAIEFADRGGSAIEFADRGIGGTGIIGVVTGFASLCVAGEEVALPASLPALVDGKPGGLDDLRAGQVVTVQAAGPANALLAREIVIRHIVIGPVQASAGGVLTVAGQQVLVGDATGAATDPAPGQSVAVSGLRQPGGMIVATRIDPAPPGPVLLRGELVLIYGTARIGAQALRLPEGSTIPGGFPVVVTGTLQGDLLVADAVARDIADESPAAYFGPSVSNFVVEGYLAAVAGGYLVSRDFVRGEGFRLERQGRGIASFSRRPEGGLVAQGRFGSAPFGAPDRAFSPAPAMPGSNPFDQGRQGFSSPRFPSSAFPALGGATAPGPAPRR